MKKTAFLFPGWAKIWEQLACDFVSQRAPLIQEDWENDEHDSE